MPARRVSTLMISVALVAFGACSDGGSGRDATKTRPASRSTTPGPVIQVARTEVAGAFWDGKIAVAGGFPTPDQAVDRLDLFDVATGTWSVGPPLPHQYDHASLAELGGRLYVVGGYTGGLSNPTNEVWSLGPGDPAWTDEPDLATRRGALGTGSAGGKLVAVGGVDENGNVLSTTEFNLVMRVKYRLVGPDGKAIGPPGEALGTTSFFRGSDVITDERQAIPLAAEELANHLVTQLSEGW